MYLGVLLVQDSNDDMIQTVMFGIVFVITIAMGAWIWIKMNKIKKVLLDEQEQRRVKKAEDQVQVVPDVKGAFERRYDEEPLEFTLQPMQPTRIV